MDAERLRAIPVFASLDPETLHAVAVFAGESSVADGSQIVSEGDYAHQFMAIEDGTADVIRGGEKIATLGPGDFFGEIGVLEKTLRAASVVATSPMRLITLTRWELSLNPSILAANPRRGSRTSANRRLPKDTTLRVRRRSALERAHDRDSSTIIGGFRLRRAGDALEQIRATGDERRPASG